MVNKESEVHSLFLTEVVRNQHDWLDMLHQSSHAYHASDQAKFVLLPTAHNLLLLVRVQHKVFLNDFCLHQNIHVELLQKDLLEEAHTLTCIKPLEVVLSSQNEGQGLIFVL